MSPKKVTKPLDIYVRVSAVRGRGGDSYITEEVQEERCRRLAEDRSYEVGEVFLDRDVSGSKMKRPELDKAVARIAEGTSGGIMVAKVDRFSRTLLGGLKTLEEINELGGVVIVADIGDGEPLNTASSTGELVLNMMLTLAQFELRRIRENWGAAQGHAVDRNIHIARHVPPGYRRAESDKGVSEKTGRMKKKILGPLEPDPKHSKTIHKAFEMAARGEPYARIARHLNERQLPSGDNGNAHWASNRIARLLANRAYLGEARYGDVVNAEAHKPLISPETWALAQRKPTVSSVSETSTHLLSGLCRCAACTYSMRPQKARGATVGSYRCQTDNASGRCPHPSSISMARIDEYVLTQFLDRVSMSGKTEKIEVDDSEAIATMEEARRDYAEVVNSKGSLRPLAYAQALDAALEQVEAAENALPRKVDFTAAVTEAREDVQTMLARFEAGESLRDLLGGDVAWMRSLLASQIRTVFIRPAASRARNLPIEDRVKIIWQDDAEVELELPKRGERFESKAFTWN